MILPTMSTLILSIGVFVALVIVDWYVSRPLLVTRSSLSPEGTSDDRDSDTVELKKVA
jgi:hypothetical protein